MAATTVEEKRMNTGIAGQLGLQVQPFFQRALLTGGHNFDFQGPLVMVDSRPASPPVRTAPAATNNASGSLAQQASLSGLGVGLNQLLNRPAGATTSQGLKVSENSARSLEIALTTRDGDRVILSLAQNTATQQSTLSSQNQGASFTINDSTVYASSRFTLSVKGNLDQGEIQAIRHLLHKAEKLASQFFAGNVSQAVEKAQDIELDGGRLASFSLTLSATRSRQISRYQAVAASNVATRPQFSATPVQQPASASLKATAVTGAQQSAPTPARQAVIPAVTDVFQQLLQGVLTLSAAPSTSAIPTTSSVNPGLPTATLSPVSPADQLTALPDQEHAHEDERELG